MALLSYDVLNMLAGDAERADRAAEWSDETWNALRGAGVFGWAIPREFGGAGLTPSEQLGGHEQIAAACLTTAFILSQREAAVRHFLRGPAHLKEGFLPRLARGELFTTVGLSQLTTSHQHGAPALRANRVDDGYRLDGEIPCITGADRADV